MIIFTEYHVFSINVEVKAFTRDMNFKDKMLSAAFISN